MTNESDHKAFLRSICMDPDSNAPRLIYCDWLEDQGDESCRLRAEYIRNSIKSDLSDRYFPLDEYHTFGYDCSIPCARSIKWIDGFYGWIEVGFDDWMQHGDQIVLNHPIRVLQITDKPCFFAMSAFGPDLYSYNSKSHGLPEYWFTNYPAEVLTESFASNQKAKAWLNSKCLSHARNKAGIHP